MNRTLHHVLASSQDFPGRGGETYTVPFSRIVYIEATDFREQDSKDFYGLAPGKTVMLRCVGAGEGERGRQFEWGAGGFMFANPSGENMMG